MFMLINICDENGGLYKTLKIVKELLDYARYIVPIGLIVMIFVDIFKKTINPDDKDGQKKILIRIIAAVLVFCVPIMIKFVLKLVTAGGGEATDGGLTCISNLFDIYK